MAKANQGYWTKKGSWFNKKHPSVKHGKVFRTKKGRVGCYVYINGERVGFEAKPRYSKKNYNYPKRRY